MNWTLLLLVQRKYSWFLNIQRKNDWMSNLIRCKTWPLSWWTLVPSRWPTPRTRWLWSWWCWWWSWWCWWWCFLRIIKMILFLSFVCSMAMISPNNQSQLGCRRKLWEPSKAVRLRCPKNQRRIWRVDWYQNLPQVKQVKPYWAQFQIYMPWWLSEKNLVEQILQHISNMWSFRILKSQQAS